MTTAFVDVPDPSGVVHVTLTVFVGPEVGSELALTSMQDTELPFRDVTVI